MSTDYTNIRLDISENIATLTIDRPSVKNALDRHTVNECHAALAALSANPEVGALIVTGAGESSFVSGADIRDIRDRNTTDGLAAISSSLFTSIERFPRPTIAAVNGYALGGGCELALACDIRVAADSAKFGQPELGLGIIPAPAPRSACHASSVSAGRSTSFSPATSSTQSRRSRLAS